MMTLPETWAWDDHDILLTGDEAAQLLAARRAEIRERQIAKLGMEDGDEPKAAQTRTLA